MRASLVCVIAVLAGGAALANEFLTEGEDIAIDVHPQHGGIVMDLAGDLWLLGSDGGEARRIEESVAGLRRPRWSPDGRSVLFLAESEDGAVIRVRRLTTGATRTVGDPTVHNQDADWHPDGDRIVYVSDRHGTGLDVWETDLPTGLSWRVTSDPGDELAPAWSANGRHLAWIHRDKAGYAIVLRVFGKPQTVLLRSEAKLSSLAWRPDGSMLTFLRHGDGGATLEMVILSDPPLVRTLIAGEDFIEAPIAWRDRMTLYYTADGRIRTRGFEDRVSRPVHFRAMASPFVVPTPPAPIPRRELAISHPPDGRLIIRARRLFDGIWPGYRSDMDIVMEAGRIESVEPSRDRQDGILLDLGDVSAIPGLIDAATSSSATLRSGASILAYGVTTIVVDELADGFDPLAWESESTPGPRVIRLPADQVPFKVSGLADGGLDDIGIVLGSRQARALGQTAPPLRRFATMRDISDMTSAIIAGSRPNRMAPGIGLHAELLALQQAGLTAEQALHAAGRNPARALGVDNQVGTITPGALADVVLISGDPLADVGNALKIVAVVRNGRFFSLVNLLEQAAAAGIVE